AFFRFEAEQDFRDNTQAIGGAGQGGLGLPDRDYYLQEDEKSRTILRNYEAHVARMFAPAGADEAAAARAARTVLEIETALAQASMARVDRRDPYRIYHRIDRGGLEGLAPSFDWDAYFDGLGH